MLMESGQAYFFTATILNWNKVLDNDHYKLVITNSLMFQVEQKRIVLYAFVIRPDHRHLIWSINEKLASEKVSKS